jgi:purine-binding chemotaxis protein CheW
MAQSAIVLGRLRGIRIRMDVVVFEVGGVRYALPAAQVQEIVRAVTIVPLPKGPPIVEGLVNVRGDVVPVLDVRTRFRLSPKPLAPTDHLILASAGSRLVAIRADCAQTLAHIDAGDVEDPKVAVRDAPYVTGVAKLPDGLVLIHDLRSFLDQAETAALDDAMAVRPGG